jgi:hypothetical protein
MGQSSLHPNGLWELGMTDRRDKTAVPGEKEEVDLPIGTHCIKVPPHVAQYLWSLAAQEVPHLDGTRVWFQNNKGRLVLHLGDVDFGEASLNDPDRS